MHPDHRCCFSTHAFVIIWDAESFLCVLPVWLDRWRSPRVPVWKGLKLCHKNLDAYVASSLPSIFWLRKRSQYVFIFLYNLWSCSQTAAHPTWPKDGKQSSPCALSHPWRQIRAFHTLLLLLYITFVVAVKCNWDLWWRQVATISPFIHSYHLLPSSRSKRSRPCLPFMGRNGALSMKLPGSFASKYATAWRSRSWRRACR